METSFENLEKLTDALYREAVEKAEKDIAQMQAEAEKERQKLLDEARAEAEEIRRQAQKEAEATQSQALRELQQKARELSEDLKSAVLNLSLGSKLDALSAEAMQDEAFVRELLLQLARDWQPQGYRLSLPEQWQAQWGAQLAKDLPGLEIQAHPQLEARFRLEKKEGGLRFDFDPEAFAALLRRYLRPETEKLLFGDHG